jgi:hypothetical protein
MDGRALRHHLERDDGGDAPAACVGVRHADLDGAHDALGRCVNEAIEEHARSTVGDEVGERGHATANSTAIAVIRP